MAMTIFIKTLEEIKSINSKFKWKFIAKLKKKIIINRAIKEISDRYSTYHFTASHIINFCKLFDGAKLMGIIEDNDEIHGNNISIGSHTNIDISYFDNSAVLKINIDNQELIFLAVGNNIRVERINNNDPNHSYRVVNTYETIDHCEKWENNKEMIEAYSYESLRVAFNLIVQLVFDALYRKEN